MAKNATFEERYKKYADLEVRFPMDVAREKPKEEDFNLIRDALKRIGLHLEYKEDYLSIKVDSKKYLKASTRFAGPKGKKHRFASNEIGLKGDVVRYSDVIKMLSNMSDKDIMKELDMSYATYYRHKKALLESDYYRSLDLNRIDEDFYLESVDFNEVF